MNDLKNKVLSQLSLMEISPKKSLGQNFLVDDYVIQKIIEAVRKKNPKNMIEVGPGLGALTNSLFSMNVPMTLVELDDEFIKYWLSKKMNAVEGDALKLNWEELATTHPTLLVSNLPYQISSSMVIDRSIGPENIQNMVLMFQKEVAERITSDISLKSYGLLSVLAQTFWSIGVVCEAGPKCFYPPPKVASRVLSLERRSLSDDLEIFSNIKNKNIFVEFIKASFLHRRKFLIKNLKSLSALKDRDAEISNTFKQLDINLKCRAEELYPVDFLILFKRLYSL